MQLRDAAAFGLACLGLALGAATAAAAKPGATGGSSTASIGISLEVRPSIRAKYVSLSSHADDHFPSRYGHRLCLDATDIRSFSLHALAKSAGGARLAPLSFTRSDAAWPQCRGTVVSLDAGEGVVTLLISPE